ALAAALAGMKPSAPRAEPAQPERAAEVSRWQPVWSVKLEEGVTRLALSPHTQPETVWAVVGKQNLAALSLDGQVRHRVALTSPILSLWAAASPAQAKAFAALVGCDDDQVLAFSADGQQRWAAKAEVAPKFKIGDRWDAPWFSDPSQNHGVLSLLVGDLWGRGEEEIALGRACTVELRGLDGQLRQRIPTHWGNNTCLASLRPSPDPGPRLLVGKFYTGHAGVSVINSAGEVLTDGGYHGVPAGASDMSAWMQQGVSHLATADLDGDGAQEVVVARSGHWNELAVYAGKGGCQWVGSFGPAASRSRFMAALAIADLDGDGRQELAVGLANGWLCVFDAKGAPRWQRRLPSAVTALAALGSRLAVGDAAGNVHLHSATGEPVATAKLDGAVTLLCSTPTHERLLVATATGELAAFRVEE
ncbi:MAG: hypothetical protein FJ272_21840, partial [Planctomycetes bacterium]|nr:hypothetical protein [Planctomycetota bacterium]